MNVALNRSRRNWVASALFAGIIALATLSGCDSAPGAGSVQMGGKEARDTIKPGEMKPSEGPTQSAPKASTPTKGRSIKDRTEQ